MSDTSYYDSDRRMIPQDMVPIDFLAPDTPQHRFVLQYLLARINFSEGKMKAFYPRWRYNEQMTQAYVKLPDYDQALKDIESEKGLGQPIAINVPFAWATQNTIVTYLLHMFGGRQPIFQVGSYRAEQVAAAKNMEMYLQYNADFTRFIRCLYQALVDGEQYGLSVIRSMWTVKKRSRFVMKPPSPDMAMLMQTMGREAVPERVRENYTCFEGSVAANIDPYMFFPDPRVPMSEVSEKGEWVAWRAFEGRHSLLLAEAAGAIKWARDKRFSDTELNNLWGDNENSARALRNLGDAHAGSNIASDHNVKPYYQIDQGTFVIVPEDLGLGPSRVPEKWLFSILNKAQIIQATPVDLPTDRHPVEVAEPNSLGYSFGQLGTADMLGPFQGVMSWFLNSHIYNVRAVLNNQLVYDPTKIETQDLKRPGPGKLIRMKNTAFGLADPKSAIFQLPVQDITRSHIDDYAILSRLASDLTGATDNVRGLQDAGGRKTATEIRTSAEAGTSRLAAKGKLESAQQFSGLAEQWALGAQANLTQEFEFNVLGAQGVADTFRITPESLYGDFYFPVHDGTLPIDKVALLDVWRQIFQVVLTDPELRQTNDVTKMFEWIAQLGGAQNITSFRKQIPQVQINPVPGDVAANDIASGRGVPVGPPPPM